MTVMVRLADTVCDVIFIRVLATEGWEKTIATEVAGESSNSSMEATCMYVLPGLDYDPRILLNLVTASLTAFHILKPVTVFADTCQKKQR